MRKVFCLICTAMLIGVICCPQKAYAGNEDEIVALINDAREYAGLGCVTIDQSLTRDASIRAAECSVRFSHTRPNGKAWYTVSRRTNGENLAHAVDSEQQQPQNVVLAWLLSPGHRANVMDSRCTMVGIAYYTGANGHTYIVCEFN